MTIDNSNLQIKKSIEKLFDWVRNQQYLGWDIYDGLNSPLLKNLRNPYIKVLVLQTNKYCPINLRPLLKIEKGIDLKGMTLFAQSYASLYRSTGEEHYLTEMQKSINYIKNKSLKTKYGYDCWASHYFPYTSIDKSTLSVDIPDVIGTCQAIIALIESYKITNRSDEKQMALNATNFLINELFQEDQLIPFFRYSKSSNVDETVIALNASAQALEAILRILSIENNKKLQTICEKITQTLLQTQNENGSWNYSIYRNGSIKRVQLDFHQGYIIDGLLAYLPHSQNDPAFVECIQKAANYYQNVMFRKDGRSFYRYPLFYPIDIHNQAQGIISFFKLGKLDRNYLKFAEWICLWTIKNMQDKSGYFYYQKWPLITNMIPHMRWGQAWMMLALATALENLGGELL